MGKKKNIQSSKNEFYRKNKLEIILFLLSALIYSNTLLNGYNLDDEFVTGENTLCQQGLTGLKKIFTSHYTEGSNSKYNYEYRPVVKATFAIEYSLFGSSPKISHLINILIYSITVIILFRLLNFLFKEKNKIFAFLVSVLFAVHPLHTEVVASLKNRDEILALMFGLLMCRSGFKFLIEKKYFHLILAILLLCLSVLSKKDGILFIALFPLMAFYFYRKEINWYLLSFITIGPYLAQKLIKKSLVPSDNYDRIFFIQENPLFGDSNLIDRVKMGISSFIFYFKIYIVPFPLRFFYGYNQIEPSEFTSFKFVLAIIISIALIFLCIKMFQKDQILSFGIAFTLISLSVYINIITPAVGIVAERFAFIPSIGLSILFISAIGYIFKIDFKSINEHNFKTVNLKFKYLLFVICIVFSVMSFSRNFKWKDRLRLFTTDIKHLEFSAKAHEVLGTEYYSLSSKAQSKAEKEVLADSAISNYKKAINIYPNYFTVYNSLGTVYFNILNNPSSAIPYFEKGIQINSKHVNGYVNLAACYISKHDTEKATKYIEIALVMDTNKTQSTLLMAAKIYNSTNDFQKSDYYINQAKIKYPLSDLLHIQHANILLERRDTISAIEQLKYSIDKKTKNENVFRFLIGHYAKRNQIDSAEYYTQLLKKINPEIK